MKNNQVHVWYADLNLPEARVAAFWAFLSEDERERAERFHFERDKVRFVVARGILRKLLGDYQGVAPEQVRFRYNKYGKPVLAQEREGDMRFNLSHAHDKAVFVFTRAAAVGVDVEYTGKELDVEGIAQRFFAVAEYQVLQSLPPAQKRQAFFTAWVRKEAVLKALGQGLSYSLAKVEVTMLPEQPVQILALHDEAQDAAEWSLFALKPGEGYAGALAVKRNIRETDVYSFEFANK